MHPLNAALKENAAGEVTGGGSGLGDERPDGTRPIEYIGVDLELEELDTGLPIVRQTLEAIGAPEGTEVHYTRDDEKLQDDLKDGEWNVGLERTFLHPGFGI